MALLGQRRQSRAAKRRERESLPSSPDDGSDVVIERLAHDGRGVARNRQGKTLFVERALPGERVETAVHARRGRFDEAHVRRLVTASAERIEPACVHFGRCGGCDLQHLAPEGQKRHKRQVLEEHCRREGVALPDIETLAGEALGYRRRARLGVRVGSNGERYFGYRLRGQERLFDVEQCPILAPRLEALLQPLRALIDALEAPRRLGHIELMAGDDEIMVTLRQLKRVPADIERWRNFADEQGLLVTMIAEGTVDERTGSEVERAGEARPLVHERLDRRGHEPLVYRPLGAGPGPEVAVESGDFLQVNALVNRRLVSQVLDWCQAAGAERVADLFAGVGNFSLALADRGVQVQAFEGRESMVRRLRDNARRNALDGRLEAVCTDLSEAPPGLDRNDLVLLDPPRGGARDICRVLGEAGPSHLIYVSCEPATLARDARLLTAGGYRVTRAAVAEMFPQTAHLEAVLMFERGSVP